MKNLYWILLAPFLFQGCASTFQKSGTEVVWINSTKTNCLEGSPMQCFEVQKNRRITDEAWTTLMDPIESLDYEHGHYYRIKMKIEEGHDSDMDSYRYKALEVLEKMADTVNPLNGKWTLFAINGIPLAQHQESIPYLNIDLPSNQISGSASCNLLNGFIGNLTHEDIDFNRVISTKMMCKEILIENEFFENLEKTEHYIVTSNSLVLRDYAGNELLSFDRSKKEDAVYSLGR